MATINEQFYKAAQNVDKLTESTNKNTQASQKGDRAWLQYERRTQSTANSINRLAEANRVMAKESDELEKKINRLITAEGRLADKRDSGSISEDDFGKEISRIDRLIENYGRRRERIAERMSANEGRIEQLQSSQDITRSIFNQQRGQALLYQIHPLLGRLSQFMPELSSKIGGVISNFAPLIAALAGVKTAIQAMISIIKEMLPVAAKQTRIQATLDREYTSEARRMGELVGVRPNEMLDIYSKSGYLGISANNASGIVARAARMSTLTGGDIAQMANAILSSFESGSSSAMLSALPGQKADKDRLEKELDRFIKAGQWDKAIDKLDEFTQSLGATDDALDEAANTTEARLNRISSKLDNIKLDLFKSWEGSINNLLSAFDGFIESDGMKQLGTSFSLLGEAVLKLGELFVRVIDGISTILYPVSLVLNTILDALNRLLDWLNGLFKIGESETKMSNTLAKYSTSGTNGLAIRTSGNQIVSLDDQTLERLEKEAERQYINAIHISQSTPSVSMTNNNYGGAPNANQMVAAILAYLNNYNASAVEGAYVI